MTAPRSKADLNRYLAAKGLPVELVKGEGYFYLVWDQPEANQFFSQTIYVFAWAQLDRAQWRDTALEFAANCVAEGIIAKQEGGEIAA